MRCGGGIHAPGRAACAIQIPTHGMGIHAPGRPAHPSHGLHWHYHIPTHGDILLWEGRPAIAIQIPIKGMGISAPGRPARARFV